MENGPALSAAAQVSYSPHHHYDYDTGDSCKSCQTCFAADTQRVLVQVQMAMPAAFSGELCKELDSICKAAETDTTEGLYDLLRGMHVLGQTLHVLT